MAVPKIRKSDKTRQYIIEKTATTFNMKGYAATSIADIETATGLTKGSIYGNFTNKDEVGAAVFAYNVEYVRQQVMERIEACNNAVDKLLAYPLFFKEYYKQFFENGGCAILNSAVEADDTNPELRHLVTGAIKSWEKKFKRIMEAGKKNKEIKPGIDSRKYAALFMTLFEGGVMLSKCTGEPYYLLSALSQMEHLILIELKQL